jgi:hypothetical protein
LAKPRPGRWHASFYRQGTQKMLRVATRETWSRPFKQYNDEIEQRQFLGAKIIQGGRV